MGSSLKSRRCAGAPAAKVVLLLADAHGGRQAREPCWAHEALSGLTRLQNQCKDVAARLCWVHTGETTFALQTQACTPLYCRGTSVPSATDSHVEVMSIPAGSACDGLHISQSALEQLALALRCLADHSYGFAGFLLSAQLVPMPST